MKANRLTRRLALLGLDATFIAALGALFLVCTPRTAQAYVDPSVVTYTIQALAGVAVALSAVLGVVWRRLRRKVYTALNIDENRNKLVEPQVHAVDPSTPEGRQALHEANDATWQDLAGIGSDRPQNIRWLARFVLALLVVGALVFIVGVTGPLETVANSLDSFPFGLEPVLFPVLSCAIVLWLVVAALLSLICGKAFNYAVGVVCALALLCVVQTLFLNTGLPLADGTAVPWEDYAQITWGSSLVWICGVAVFVIWARMNGQALRTAVAILSIVVVALQAVSMGTTFADAQALLDRNSGGDVVSGRPLVTTVGMDEVSTKDNVVMFVLDTFDNKYMDAVLERYPDALDEFTGFTRYYDSSGVMIPTRFGMSALITGQTLDHSDEMYNDTKIAEWYSEDNLVDAIKDAGYNVELYVSDVPQGLVALSERVDNIEYVDVESPYWGTVESLWKCSLYRALPWVAKPPFWYYSGDIVNALLGDSTQATFGLDDAKYLDELQENGLTFSESVTEGENGTYKIIHLMGSHYPMTLSDTGERVSADETDQIAQSRGSLLCVETYLDEMKRLGVYDSSTIIVTADHGEWYLANDINRPTSPMLLVKPAKTAEAAEEPLKVSMAPVSQMDLSATLLKAMGADYSEWGTPVDDVPEDEERVRRYWATSVDLDAGNKWTFVKEWEIDGPVRDWSSWTETGKSWVINP